MVFKNRCDLVLWRKVASALLSIFGIFIAKNIFERREALCLVLNVVLIIRQYAEWSNRPKLEENIAK